MTRKAIDNSPGIQDHLKLLTTQKREHQRHNAQAIYDAFLAMPTLPDIIEHAMQGNGDLAERRQALVLNLPYGERKPATLNARLKILSPNSEEVISLAATLISATDPTDIFAECTLALKSRSMGKIKTVTASGIMYSYTEGLGLGTGLMACLNPAVESLLQTQKTFFANATELRIEIIDGAYSRKPEGDRKNWTSHHAAAGGLDHKEGNTYEKRHPLPGKTR